MVLAETIGFIVIIALILLILLQLVALVLFIRGLIELWKNKERGLFWLTLGLAFVITPLFSLFIIAIIRTIQRKQFGWLVLIILFGAITTIIYFLTNKIKKGKKR